MNRRFFSKFLALCAGSVGFWQTAARGEDKTPAAPADRPEGSPTAPNGASQPDRRHQEPVNVADFQDLARTALPRATYDYITTGTTDEVTLRENVAAFQRIRILPPLLTGVAEVDTTTTLLKQEIALPILLAPVAGQSLYHRQGALAAARAAAAAHTILGVSSSAGNSVEEIAAASQGPKWFQLYVPKDRTIARKLLERAEGAGYKAIIVTVDLGERKDADRRNRFALPQNVLLKHLRRTPVRGGITYREAHLAMETICDSNAMLSMEVVEVNPVIDEQNRTAILAVELVMSALGKRIL